MAMWGRVTGSFLDVVVDCPCRLSVTSQLTPVLLRLSYRRVYENPGTGVRIGPKSMYENLRNPHRCRFAVRRFGPGFMTCATQLCGALPGRVVFAGRRRASQVAVAVHLHGPPGAPLHVLVLVSCPGTARPRGRASGRLGGYEMTPVAPTLQAFVTERLARQRQASPRTVASYRDTLRLLLCFVQESSSKAPSALCWDDLDEPVVGPSSTTWK